MRAGRSTHRRFLHQRIGVRPQGGGPLFLPLAEGIAEPAHRQAGVEADPLDHPLSRYRMAEGAKPYLWVDQRLVQDEGVLPEAPPDNGIPPRFGYSDTDQPELRVGPTDYDRSSFLQAR